MQGTGGGGDRPVTMLRLKEFRIGGTLTGEAPSEWAARMRTGPVSLLKVVPIFLGSSLSFQVSSELGLVHFTPNTKLASETGIYYIK